MIWEHHLFAWAGFWGFGCIHDVCAKMVTECILTMFGPFGHFWVKLQKGSSISICEEPSRPSIAVIINCHLSSVSPSASEFPPCSFVGLFTPLQNKLPPSKWWALCLTSSSNLCATSSQMQVRLMTVPKVAPSKVAGPHYAKGITSLNWPLVKGDNFYNVNGAGQWYTPHLFLSSAQGDIYLRMVVGFLFHGGLFIGL